MIRKYPPDICAGPGRLRFSHWSTAGPKAVNPQNKSPDRRDPFDFHRNRC